MTRPYDLDEIKDYWTSQAKEHGQDAAASWSDTRMIHLEIAQLLDFIDDGDRVLDVGCANGYSTLQLAHNRQTEIRGLDYVPEMIASARTRLRDFPPEFQARVSFAEGDITNLSEPEGAYDKLICVRVLINLHNQERQIAAIRQCARVVKEGGLVLFSEATKQGWERLNKFRREWGLPDIPMPSFNHYLDLALFDQDLGCGLRLERVIDFASTYYVATRVLKPLLSAAAAAGVNVADPNLEWNRWAATLPAWGDYGVQKLLVLRKTSSAG